MSMNNKEELKLAEIINHIDEELKSNKRFKKYNDFLADSLKKCELKIDKYPYAQTRAAGKVLVNYVFKVNDEDCEINLKDNISQLATLVEELLEDDYELSYDDDGNPLIVVKRVREDLKFLPSKPKISFSGYVNIVLNHLEKAKISIIGAMAWITNKQILDKLIVKAKEGIVISLIADNNETNLKLRQKDSKYEVLPFPIYYVKNMEKDYWENNGTMHDKFCVIDNSISLYGTFNWSDHAVINDETITEDANITSINSFIDEYKKLVEKYHIGLNYPVYSFKSN